jgi:hemolysin activation/secretion protein
MGKTGPARISNWLSVFVFFLVIFAAGNESAAQTVPGGGGLQQPRPGDRRLELPDIEPLPKGPDFKLPTVPKVKPEAPLSSGPRFLLKGVRFEGNTVFSDADLIAVAAPFIDRPVSTEDIERLRRELTLHYIDAGYVNSGLVLPDQRVIDGVVVFQIVEGELTNIEITGTETMRPFYVRDRLSLGAGPPLNVKRLQERFRILMEDPLIDRLDAELGPGEQPGESVLKVDVSEPPVLRTFIGFDNARSPSVGAEGGTVDIGFRNLIGIGETMSFGVTKSEGLFDSTIRASAPLNAHDTRLSFNFERSKSDVVERPFNIVDIENESDDYELELRHPFYRAPGQEFATGLQIAYRTSTTTLLGDRFSFSPGVDDGRSRVWVARLVSDWLDRSADAVFAVRSTVSLGLDIFNATTNSGTTPDGQFVSWLGQAQWVRRIADGGARLVLRGDTQLTPDRLLPLEKFSVGGIDTVRGYRENLLTRDNGWAASIEVRIPIFELRIPHLSSDPAFGQVEFAPFFDAGRSWDNDIKDAKPKSIYSVGAGLRWAPSPDLFFNVYYGMQLRDVNNPPDSDLQDDGIHFRMGGSVFF